MSDEVLPYYNRELSYIRRLAAHFARAHPKIAARLRLGADASQDPHVERLLEGFAYLTARVRHKIEDDFPEITEALLGVLYPHYRTPIPSMSIIQLDLDPAQNEITTGQTLPRGTALETDTIQGEPCRFQTCYPVTLWPITVEAATLSGPPFQAPPLGPASQASAVLRLQLACRSPKVKFSNLSLRSLRFFLKGQDQHVFPLYEAILNNALGVALANGPDDPAALLLDRAVLRPVGFGRDEGLLPYGPRSFLGYRLLTEFFTFPQKFLFFDLAGLTGRVLSGLGNRMEVFVYLSKHTEELEKNVAAETFRLGCTPMVNLYPRRAEPVTMTQTDTEYRVVPDARRPLHHEVYTVDKVVATPPDGEPVEFHPFYATRHSLEGKAGNTFWHSVRRPAEQSDEEGQTDKGTEVFVSLVDLEFRSAVEPDWTLEVETTCLNRDLPSQLPFGDDQPKLQFVSGGALVSKVRCLMAPTRTVRPAMRRGTLWRLISHLSLNHLSLVGDGDQAESLREILKVYDFIDSDETRKLVNGVTRVQSRRVTGRIGQGAAAFCRGLEVTLEFDPANYTGSGLFLFASVLERFLGLYCTVNSFTRVVATLKGRDEELKRWPPRAGEQVLV